MASVAFAAESPIKEGTPASDIAGQANQIFKVFNLRAGDEAYKIVEMDTRLNGDLNSTIVVLVGTDVGGAAGYEEAYQIGPNLLSTLRDARVQGDRIVVSGGDGITGNVKTISIKFDPASKMLSTR